MIDVSAFGSGAGLVLLGWVCGCVVGMIRTAMTRGIGL